MFIEAFFPLKWLFPNGRAKLKMCLITFHFFHKVQERIVWSPNSIGRVIEKFISYF